MTRAATAMRSRISHSGVRAGVSSVGLRPNSSRMAGKLSVRGAGGVTLSSSQMSGMPASARSIHGWVKASAPRLNMPPASYL